MECCWHHNEPLIIIIHYHFIKRNQSMLTNVKRRMKGVWSVDYNLPFILHFWLQSDASM